MATLPAMASRAQARLKAALADIEQAEEKLKKELAKRDKAIRELAADGVPQADIARIADMSRQAVFWIINPEKRPVVSRSRATDSPTRGD